MLLLHPRIDIVADVAVRPAVKSAVLQRSEIIRRQVVAQFVPLVDAGPELSRHRLKRQPYGIPQPRRILPRILSVRIAKRSEEHTSELQSLAYLVCRLPPEKNNQMHYIVRLH